MRTQRFVAGARELTCGGWLAWFDGSSVRGCGIRSMMIPAFRFTPEEFSRLVRSGRREDMKLLAEGLACRSIPRRIKYRATH